MFVLSVFLVILAATLVLLASPIGLEYVFNNRGQQKQQLRVTWLFGLARFNLNKSAKLKPVKNISLATTKIKLKKKSKKRSNLKPVLAGIQSKGFIKRVFYLLRELIMAIEIKHLNAQIWFGLDDPADTGRIYGYLSPLVSMTYFPQKWNIKIFPMFQGLLFETEFKTQIQIVPARIVFILVRFLFARETLGAIKSAFKAR